MFKDPNEVSVNIVVVFVIAVNISSALERNAENRE
jgi:hypothetical protein